MSADDFFIYDSNEVSMVMAGIPIEGGLAEDTFVEIEPLSPVYTTTVGADGSVTRSKNNDFRATIRVTLMQTSKANLLLSALYNLGRRTTGKDIGPALVKDNSGASLYTGEKSWIAKRPTVAFSKKGEARQWEFEVANLQAVDGGN